MRSVQWPRGPRGQVLLGSAGDFRRDAFGFLRALQRDYGDVASFRLGAHRLVLVSHPDAIDLVLQRGSRGFRKPRLVTGLGRLLFGEALTATDGATWRRQRRLAAPAFHRPRVEGFAAEVVAHTGRMLDGWRTGEVRALDDEALRLFIQIGAQALLGADLGRDAGVLGAAIGDALSAYGARVQLGLATPDWLPLPHTLRLRHAMRRIHRVVAPIIEAGGQRAAGATDHQAGGELLSMLLAATDGDGRRLSPSQLRDELSVMFVLGGHQLSLALTWALHLLSQHPHAEARLHAELDAILDGAPATAAHLSRLRYTRAVIDEALRLYPPFFLLVREALADVTLDGHHVPRGTIVAMSPWVTQRDARWFAAPDTFAPERWIDGLADRLPRGAYLPFGGGPRVCIAEGLVTTQLTLVLATIAQRFALRATGPVTPHATVTLGRRAPLSLTVAERALVARPPAEVRV